VDDAVVITATLTDQYGNTVADGTQVTFTTSLNLGDGSFSPEVGHTADGVVVTILTATLTGSGMLTAATTGNVSDTAIITFTPGALTFFWLSGYPASIAAGSSFTSSVVVAAYDAYGNLKTDYIGPVYFVSTDLRITSSTIGAWPFECAGQLSEFLVLGHSLPVPQVGACCCLLLCSTFPSLPHGDHHLGIGCCHH